jgi:hypothetical protein
VVPPKLLALTAPLNPNGLPNSEVVIPWIIAKDLSDRPKGMYIVDFKDRTEAEAALFEMPFEYVRHHVYPSRQENRRLRGERGCQGHKLRSNSATAVYGTGSRVLDRVTSPQRILK